MQQSIRHYTNRTHKTAAGWVYARSMPILTDVIEDVRDAAPAARSLKVRTAHVAAKYPRRAHIDWSALQRHAEDLHVAEALGNLPAVHAEIAQRMETRQTLRSPGIHMRRYKALVESTTPFVVEV